MVVVVVVVGGGGGGSNACKPYSDINFQIQIFHMSKPCTGTYPANCDANLDSLSLDMHVSR